MADIPLLDHITQAAEREIAAIIAEAEAEAARITEAAQNQAERMIADVHDRVAAETGRIRERRMNTIRFAHNARLYDTKSRALADIWREVDREAAMLERSDRYLVLLGALFAEVAAVAPDGAVVHAAAADVDAVELLAARSGRSFTVTGDSAIHGGVAFHWPDGGTVLINTLSHRLARLRAEGNAELSRILFAGEEEP